MSTSDAGIYDSPRTFRGQLQRGLGNAAYRARFDPAAGDLVRECLRHDYRWDWQVDDRDVYLARLARDLRLDPAVLDRQMRACGPRAAYDELDPSDTANQFDVAEGVLATLALGGDADARTLLRDYVRDGTRWVETLTTVSGAWPRSWWDDLWEAAAARLDPAGDYPLAEPWLSWRGRDARIDTVIESRPARRCRTGSRSAHLSTDALVALLPTVDRATAIGLLRELLDREPAPQLLSVCDHLDPGLPLLHGVLRRIGSAALGHARTWARADDHPLAWTGMTIVADHGDHQDVEQLLRSVEWLRSRDGDLCGFDTLVTGLARVLGPGTSAEHTAAVRVATRLLMTSPHSYERADYLRSLLILDRERATRLLPACLLDCESRVRMLAVEHVDRDDPIARQLLGELRDDPLESDALRASAAARLDASG